MMNEIIKEMEKTYNYKCGYYKGGLDTIDEYSKMVELWCWKHQEYSQDDLNDLLNIAERLKEHKR